MAYLPPPRAMYVNMHVFYAGDTELPNSLTTVLSSLRDNEYLIRGNVFAQIISAYVYNPGTGTAVQYYDAYNVTLGDWLATDATGYTWQIKELYNITTDSNPSASITSGEVMYAKMVDVDNYNAGLDITGNFIGAPAFIDNAAVVFTVDEDGFPIFTPSDTFVLQPNFSANVIGRFRALNLYNQYVNIYQEDVSGTFSVGDSIYYNNGIHI